LPESVFAARNLSTGRTRASLASFAARCVRLDVGAYYQWDNNCKVTGRAGVQSFGGAQLINLTPFQPLPNRW
jgi:hypothetical protein